MTKEGLELLTLVKISLDAADTALSKIESDHLAVAEEKASRDLYGMRQDIMNLGDRISDWENAWDSETGSVFKGEFLQED